MCRKMSILVRRQLQDQLPGGKFHVPSIEVLEATSSAPLTNKISEADFSDLDRMVNKAPQKSTIGKSAAVCFTRNKSAKWLQSLPASIRTKYIKRARELAPQRKRNFLWMKKVRAKRRELQQARQTKRKNALENKLSKMAALKDRVESSKFGVMENEAVVRQCLGKLSSVQVKKHVKDQVLYHKLILNSIIHEKSLGQWRFQGKVFTAEMLSENLIKIINRNWPDGAPDHIKALNVRIEQQQVNVVDGAASVVTHPRLKRSHEKGSTGTKAGARSKKRKVKPVLPEPVTCSVGSYVAVAFEDGKWYPGLVMQMQSESDITKVDIMYMHPSGTNAFKWPAPQDRCPTDPKYIIANINVNMKDARGRLWTVEEKTEVDRAYKVYARAYFQ